MREFGDLSGIVFNRTTQRLVGGHQRMKHIPEDAEVVIEQRVQKSPVGTVALGHVVLDGEQWRYREVKWPEEKEKAANLAANKFSGEWDLGLLAPMLDSLDEFDFPIGFTADEIEQIHNDLSGGEENPYTQTIKSPIYEPSKNKPNLSELMDRSRTDDMIQEIEASGLPEEIRAFLRSAAERHVAFRFDKIADFYAHSSATVQRLMERSALVVIDFNKAIEEGFVSLNTTAEEIFKREYPDA